VTVAHFIGKSYSALRAYHFLFSGTDATEAFEDVGHSDEARALLPGMLVGDFDKSSGVRIPYRIPYLTISESSIYFNSVQDIKLFDSPKQS